MSRKKAEKKEKPLATGFISKGNIYFNLKFSFTEEFSIYNKIGKDLIDFVWLDTEDINSFLNYIWARYILLRNERNEYEFILSGLTYISDKFMKINCYLTVYLLTFIDFLTKNQIDDRVLTYERAIKGFEQEYAVGLEDGEVIEDVIIETAKKEFLNVFLDCVMERQAVAEKTLTHVLGDRNIDSGQSPMARLYKMEQEDAFFRKHWSSHFESFIGRVNENADKYANLTILDTIDDMMRYELTQMIVRNVE
jgi:hypothetical protein